MTDWEKYLDDTQDRFLEELFDYLRIPATGCSDQTTAIDGETE